MSQAHSWWTVFLVVSLFGSLGPVSGQCSVNGCEVCPTPGGCQRCFAPYYLQSGSCVTQCLPGFYANPSLMECQSCSSECSTCFGSASNCIFCRNQSKVQLRGACVDQCPQSYLTSSGANRVCRECPLNCLSCAESQFLPRCLECGAGFFLASGACLTACPAETRFSEVSRSCAPLAENSGCPPPRVENLNGVCSFVCSPLSYLNETTRKCFPCSDKCPQGCSGPTASDCLTCDSACATCQGVEISSCLTCRGSRSLREEYQNFWGECFCDIKSEESFEEECEDGQRTQNYRNALMVLPWLMFSLTALQIWRKRGEDSGFYLLVMLDYLQQFGLLALSEKKYRLQLDLVLAGYLRVFTPSLWVRPTVFETHSWEEGDARPINGNSKLFTLLSRSFYFTSNQAWFLITVALALTLVAVLKFALRDRSGWKQIFHRADHTIPTFLMTFSQTSLALDLALFGQNFPLYEGTSERVVQLLLFLGTLLLNTGFYLYLWQRFQVKNLLQAVGEEGGKSEDLSRGFNSSQALLVSARKFLSGLIAACLHGTPRAQGALLFLLQLAYSSFTVYQIQRIRRRRKCALVLTEVYVSAVFLLFFVGEAALEDAHATLYALLTAFYSLQVLSALRGVFAKKETSVKEDPTGRTLEGKNRAEEAGQNGGGRRQKKPFGGAGSQASSRAQIALVDESISGRSSRKGYNESSKHLERSSVFQGSGSGKELEVHDYDQVLNYQHQSTRVQSNRNIFLEPADVSLRFESGNLAQSRAANSQNNSPSGEVKPGEVLVFEEPQSSATRPTPRICQNPRLREIARSRNSVNSLNQSRMISLQNIQFLCISSSDEDEEKDQGSQFKRQQNLGEEKNTIPPPLTRQVEGEDKQK